MIITDNKVASVTLFQQILMELEKSKFQFYLTGSRYFGNAIPESDYDYFTDSGEEVRKFLLSMGFFVKEGAENYVDNITVEVMFWTDNENCIDVQLVSDAQRKYTAQVLLSSSPTLNGLISKRSVHKIVVWELAMACVKAGIDLERKRNKT